MIRRSTFQVINTYSFFFTTVVERCSLVDSLDGDATVPSGFTSAGFDSLVSDLVVVCSVVELCGAGVTTVVWGGGC